MKDPFRLCIGDIHLAISCSGKVPLQSPSPQYGPFRDKSAAETDTFHITIQPETAIPWEESKYEKIFTSDGAWSLFRNGSDYAVTITPEWSGGRPVCVATFSLGVTEVKIYCERTLLVESASGPVLPNPFAYPLDRILMMYILSGKSGMMIHAAAAEIEGRGFIFPGVSGAGKSTLAKQLASSRGPVVLTDERVLVRRVGGQIRAFGTPWHGDAGIVSSGSARLSAMLFIRHGASNRMSGMPSRRAFEDLLPLAAIPWYDPDIMTGILSFCEDLVSEVPAYELHCLPGNEVVDLLADFASNFEPAVPEEQGRGAEKVS